MGVILSGIGGHRKRPRWHRLIADILQCRNPLLDQVDGYGNPRLHGFKPPCLALPLPRTSIL